MKKANNKKYDYNDGCNEYNRNNYGNAGNKQKYENNINSNNSNNNNNFNDNLNNNNEPNNNGDDNMEIRQILCEVKNKLHNMELIQNVCNKKNTNNNINSLNNNDFINDSNENYPNNFNNNNNNENEIIICRICGTKGHNQRSCWFKPGNKHFELNPNLSIEEQQKQIEMHDKLVSIKMKQQELGKMERTRNKNNYNQWNYKDKNGNNNNYRFNYRNKYTYDFNDSYYHDDYIYNSENKQFRGRANYKYGRRKDNGRWPKHYKNKTSNEIIISNIIKEKKNKIIINKLHNNSSISATSCESIENEDTKLFINIKGKMYNESLIKKLNNDMNKNAYTDKLLKLNWSDNNNINFDKQILLNEENDKGVDLSINNNNKNESKQQSKTCIATINVGKLRNHKIHKKRIKTQYEKIHHHKIYDRRANYIKQQDWDLFMDIENNLDIINLNPLPQPLFNYNKEINNIYIQQQKQNEWIDIESNKLHSDLNKNINNNIRDKFNINDDISNFNTLPHNYCIKYID